MKIAIVTATFNRVQLLKRLYESLENQNLKQFSWIIVDDGSTDSTENYISKIQPNFELIYIKQTNGGKARALNNAFQHHEKFDLFIIVDSDDYLLPNAIQNIIKKGEEYLSINNVGAIFFRYQDNEGNLLTKDKANDSDEIVLSRIEHDAKYQKADGCIGYFSKAISKYRYPEFEGEKYLGPTVIQLMMGDEFKIAFTQDIIGVAEYQEGGLSKSGRRLRMENPNGMICYGVLQMNSDNNFYNRLKYAITLWPYIEKLNEPFAIGIKYFPNKFLGLVSFIPGKLLAIKWTKKNQQNK